VSAFAIEIAETSKAGIHAMSDTPETLVRLDVVVPYRLIHQATAFFFQRVPYGWEEEESVDGATFRLHLEDPARAEALAQDVAVRWPDVQVLTEQVPRRDWALAWREFFTAVPCGEDFIVIAPWMEQEQPYKERIPILIEPKTAFGTGHHPTTALCLEVVSRLHREGRIAPGMRFLDLGTGSGILGLGCAKLGLTGLGLDIDPLAIDNCRENKPLNQVGDEFLVDEGSVEKAGDEAYDLVLANILAEPLIALAPQIAARVRSGGCLVLSGLLVLQKEQVAEAYTGLGLPEPESHERGEWAALVWPQTPSR
jgi:ribosomal protein L11 methyltransferase